MKVTSLLTPLIRMEIPDLLRWIAFSPNPFLNQDEAKLVSWHLSIDDEWEKSEKEDILSFVQNSHFNLFQIVFHSLKMDPRESVYLRNIKKSDLVDLPYGSKSGPNKQFYESLKLILDHSICTLQDALLLLEVDAIPIKQGWLSQLDRAIDDKPEFLIAGSRYQGKSELSSRISQHFNGNAIYGIGRQDFREFLMGWESLLRHIVPVCHWIAYDICFEWAINSAPHHDAEISQKYESLLNQYKLATVDISDYIVNASGAHEISNDAVYLDVLKQSHLIIHSKPFSKRIDYMLAGLGLTDIALLNSHPLNSKLQALAKSPYGYFSSPNASKVSVQIVNKLLNTQIHINDPLVCSMVKSCIRKP